MGDSSWQSKAPPNGQDLEQGLIASQEPPQYNRHQVDHIHQDFDQIKRLVEGWWLQA